jgi:hypothetical protein
MERLFAMATLGLMTLMSFGAGHAAGDKETIAVIGTGRTDEAFEYYLRTGTAPKRDFEVRPAE